LIAAKLTKTNQLSEEPMTEAIERLQQALRHERARVAHRIMGQTFECPLG